MSDYKQRFNLRTILENNEYRVVDAILNSPHELIHHIENLCKINFKCVSKECEEKTCIDGLIHTYHNLLDKDTVYATALIILLEAQEDPYFAKMLDREYVFYLHNMFLSNSRRHI